MWAILDKSEFPNVYVKFNDRIDNEEGFKTFLKEWLDLYKDRKEFTFIFDTRNVGMVNISYCYKLKNFISQLKELPKQYLQKSIIIVSSKYVRYLLSIIFKITKPVAVVYIYNKDDVSININKEILKILKEQPDDFTVINP